MELPENRVQVITVRANNPQLPEPTLTAVGEALVKPHENDPTPHSAYDSIPDLASLYANNKI